jgi:hypothetical protein
MKSPQHIGRLKPDTRHLTLKSDMKFVDEYRQPDHIASDC